MTQVNKNEVKFEIMSNGKKKMNKDGLEAKIDAALEQAMENMDPSEFTSLEDKMFVMVPEEMSHLYRGTKGCHQIIHWDYMKKVAAPDEFHVNDDEAKHVSTDDILTLPKEAKSVFDAIDRQLKAKKKN